MFEINHSTLPVNVYITEETGLHKILSLLKDNDFTIDGNEIDIEASFQKYSTLKEFKHKNIYFDIYDDCTAKVSFDLNVLYPSFNINDFMKHLCTNVPEFESGDYVTFNDEIYIVIKNKPNYNNQEIVYEITKLINFNNEVLVVPAHSLKRLPNNEPLFNIDDLVIHKHQKGRVASIHKSNIKNSYWNYTYIININGEEFSVPEDELTVNTNKGTITQMTKMTEEASVSDEPYISEDSKKDKKDIYDILQGHCGETFFSVAHGPLILKRFTTTCNGGKSSIVMCQHMEGNEIFFTPDGKICKEGQSILFPSEDSCDWDWWDKNNNQKKAAPFDYSYVTANLKTKWYEDLSLSTLSPNHSKKIRAINKLLVVRHWIEDDKNISNDTKMFHIYIDTHGKLSVAKNIYTKNHVAYFSSQENAMLAINILGDELYDVFL